MGYKHINEGFATFTDAANCASCFAAALGVLLENKEGVLIELPINERQPEVAQGKYVVWCDRDHFTMRVEKVQEGDPLMEIPAGQILIVSKQIDSGVTH